MSHNEGMYYPPKTLGPGWEQPYYSDPPQNQNPPKPDQNICPISIPSQKEGYQCAHQNQGPAHPQITLFTQQNQGNFGPTQDQRPLCPAQNHQFHQFSPQNLGPQFTPLNHGPVCLPQDQESHFQSQYQSPPINQAPVLSSQNQDPHYPSQNQGHHYTLLNQGALFPVQTQDPMGPPQNQESQFSPRIQEQNQIPGFKGSGYIHPHGAVQNCNDYRDSQYEGNDRNNQHKNVDEWSNQNDNSEGWSNQNKDEEELSIQLLNHNKKSTLKPRMPIMRGHAKGFIDKEDFANPTFKSDPNKNAYKSTSNITTSLKKCSNNIQINIVKLSDLDLDVKLKNNQLDHILNKSEQCCPYQKKKSTSKLVESINSMKSNESPSKTWEEQSQMECQAIDTQVGRQLLEQGIVATEFSSNKINQNCPFSKQRTLEIKSTLKAKQSKYKHTRIPNKHQDVKRDNMLKRSKQQPAVKINLESDDKGSQVILNTTIKSAKKNEKHEYSKLKNAHTNNSLLQNNNKTCSKPNKVQVKEKGFENTKDSSVLNREPLPLNTSLTSLKTSNLKREKIMCRKRLNPQGNNTSAYSKRIRGSDKPVVISQIESPSKVMSMDENLQSESIQNQIEGVITGNKREVKNHLDNTFKDTASSRDVALINKTAGIHCESTEMLGPNEFLVENQEKYFNEPLSMKTKTDNTTDVSSNYTRTDNANNVQCNENPVPGDTTIIIASDGRINRSMNNIKSKEALANKLIDLSENISEAIVDNHTNSSDMSSTTSERTFQEYFKRYDESQDSDMQTNYYSLNDDSQNSSCLSGNCVNVVEANIREFDILDEVEGSDDDEVQSTFSNEESNSEVCDQEAPEEDEEGIHAMLEGLDINTESTEKVPKKVSNKVILEEIGDDNLELLPEGWVKVMLDSGMPLYHHQETKVCLMSKPYFLGPGSVRSHKIPISSVPCLQYKRALEAKKKKEEGNKAKQAEVSENTGENLPTESEISDKVETESVISDKVETESVISDKVETESVISYKVETAEEQEAAQSLDPSELQEYCNKVFKFKTISIMQFKNWGDRRKYGRIMKDLKKQRPPLPSETTELLKCPIQKPDGAVAKSKGEWVINQNTKSYVCILHEYVQHTLKQHPKYVFKELKNPSTPYSATVYIGEMQYGTGIGPSKKHAKLEAAKAALEVLIPEMKDKMENNEFGINSGISKKPQNYKNSIFDQIHIEDPRVAEFCAETIEPSPYAILVTCLQRNGMGLNNVKVEYNMNSETDKEDEFKMIVNNHTATVMCKNKREGKQKAAQAILKALHPNIEYFGSLLRMYGNHSTKSVKEKKQEETEITGLQRKAVVNQPNYAILRKLRKEMQKCEVERKELLAKGYRHRDFLFPGPNYFP